MYVSRPPSWEPVTRFFTDQHIIMVHLGELQRVVPRTSHQVPVSFASPKLAPDKPVSTSAMCTLHVTHGDWWRHADVFRCSSALIFVGANDIRCACGDLHWRAGSTVEARRRDGAVGQPMTEQHQDAGKEGQPRNVVAAAVNIAWAAQRAQTQASAADRKVDFIEELARRARDEVYLLGILGYIVSVSRWLENTDVTMHRTIDASQYSRCDDAILPIVNWPCPIIWTIPPPSRTIHGRFTSQRCHLKCIWPALDSNTSWGTMFYVLCSMFYVVAGGCHSVLNNQISVCWFIRDNVNNTFVVIK